MESPALQLSTNSLCSCTLRSLHTPPLLYRSGSPATGIYMTNLQIQKQEHSQTITQCMHAMHAAALHVTTKLKSLLP